MLSWFRSKSLVDYLNETKKVRIKGVNFRIKRIDVSNHLDGSKVLLQSYDIYKSGADKEQAPNQKKIKEHFAQVLVAGIVSPKISFKKEEGGVCVDDLFIDWEMVYKLYESIMFFTYGKKKVKLNT